MDAEELERVKVIVDKVRQSNVSNKASYFANTYANFRKKYPMLYDMICSSTCDDNMLNYMLSMLEKVSNGQHTNDSASVEVGQTLFDKYVASVVDVEKLKRKDA